MAQAEQEIQQRPKTVADVLSALDEAAETYLRVRGRGERKREAAHQLRKAANRLYAVERQEAPSE